MLTLNKILSLLIYPLSLCLICFVFALVFRARGAVVKANTLTILATIWLYFCSTEWGAGALLSPLESAYPAFVNEELPNAQAILVLGSGTSGESQFGQGGDLNHAADRLWLGAALHRAGKAPLIVLSGGSVHPDAVPESRLMAQKLKAIGIPETALLLESESRTTRENALYSWSLLQELGITHVLLVTSASHMRRAAAVFGAQGFVVTSVATDHQMPLRVGPVPGWLPTLDRLARSTQAIHEWVGYWVYEQMGYFEPPQVTLET